MKFAKYAMLAAVVVGGMMVAGCAGPEMDFCEHKAARLKALQQQEGEKNNRYWSTQINQLIEKNCERCPQLAK